MLGQQLTSLNRAVALERLGGDEEILQDIARLFLEDYPQQVEALRQAITAGDARGIERVAHALKGAVSNFAADSVTNAAYQLEQMGRDGAIANAPAVFADLVEKLAALSTDLHAICAA